MTLQMNIRHKENCVEVWLDIKGHKSLFLDLYFSGEIFCDSGNLKRMTKLNPKAKQMFVSFKV